MRWGCCRIDEREHLRWRAAGAQTRKVGLILEQIDDLTDADLLMGVGVDGGQGDQNVHRVVILMAERDRRPQGDQRKAGLDYPSSGRPCGMASPGASTK